jgi:hypothetical protein
MRTVTSRVVVATRALALVALAAFTLACAATQQALVLPEPPSRHAPLAERDAYYEDKKPLGIAGAPNAVNQLGWLAPATFPILILADGTKVADPQSLLPAVDHDSPTATATRKGSDLRLFTNSVYTVSALGLSVGLGTIVVAPVLLAGGGGDPAAALSVTLFGLAGTVGGAFGIGWAAQLAEEAEAEKMAALLLYEADLRRRLALVRPDEVLEKKWIQTGAAARPKKEAPAKQSEDPAPAPVSPAAPAAPTAPTAPGDASAPEASDDPSEPPPLLSPEPAAP